MKHLTLTLALLTLALTSFACSGDGAPESTPDPGTAHASGAGTPSAGLGVAGTPDPRTQTAAPSGTRAAVILVHGWFGSPREFSAMKAFLDANGFRSFIAILPGEDNVKNAEYLRGFAQEVEEVAGVDQVNAVGFSMGGLSLRYYLQFLGGDAEVRRYISIDTAQTGDPAACLLPADFGGQMCPLSPFIRELNEGDDTPGDVAYTTILNKQGSEDRGRLRGDATEVTVDGPHGELLTDAAVHRAVLAALRS